MTKAKWLVALVMVLGIAGVIGAASIDEIMTKGHKAKTGLRDQIKMAADAASPNWADIQKKTKEFSDLAATLEKNDPPKGEKDSWKKLCKEYVDLVKALDTAAGKKDAKALAEANKKLGASCKGCHDAHQP
jgi:putative NADH-flavin reductase